MFDVDNGIENIKGIKFGFENVEVIYIPIKYIKELTIGNISLDKYKNGTVRTFKIVIDKMADTDLKYWHDFDKRGRTTFGRFKSHQDIVDMCFVHNDEKRMEAWPDLPEDDGEQLYVHWQENSDPRLENLGCLSTVLDNGDMMIMCKQVIVDKKVKFDD